MVEHTTNETGDDDLIHRFHGVFISKNVQQVSIRVRRSCHKTCIIRKLSIIQLP